MNLDKGIFTQSPLSLRILTVIILLPKVCVMIVG